MGKAEPIHLLNISIHALREEGDIFDKTAEGRI